MSMFDKAVDSVKSVNPIEGLGDNLLNQLSPVLGDSKGLNIINEMRGVGSIVPKEFPSIDALFGDSFPSAESLLQGASIENISNVFLGDNAAAGIAGGKDGIAGLLDAAGGGEGGIGSLLGQFGPVLDQILPLIAKLAPLALAII